MVGWTEGTTIHKASEDSENMKVRVLGKTLEIDQSLVKNKTGREIAEDIEDYLNHERSHFNDYELRLSEFTPFQRRVLTEMRKIPAGATVSYKRLAERIGKPRAYRAVANACGANPLPIIIPCHRVVGSHSIGGYSAGVSLKKKLLRFELR